MTFCNKIFNVRTLRVWRSQVNEPPLTMESEHNLDFLTTDYVAISISDKIDDFHDRFLQYDDLVFDGLL